MSPPFLPDNRESCLVCLPLISDILRLSRPAGDRSDEMIHKSAARLRRVSPWLSPSCIAFVLSPSSLFYPQVLPFLGRGGVTFSISPLGEEIRTGHPTVAAFPFGPSVQHSQGTSRTQELGRVPAWGAAGAGGLCLQGEGAHLQGGPISLPALLLFRGLTTDVSFNLVLERLPLAVTPFPATSSSSAQLP